LSVTIDTNLLVYASNASDHAQPKARETLARLVTGPEPLFLFWPVLLGYVRITTQPSLPASQSFQAATRNIDRLLSAPTVRAVGEADGFWQAFRATAGDWVRGRVVTDAHIVALMRQHGVRTIYTRDRDFRRFDGIDPIDPFA
jgi:uncharacterized protein